MTSSHSTASPENSSGTNYRVDKSIQTRTHLPALRSRWRTLYTPRTKALAIEQAFKPSQTAKSAKQKHTNIMREIRKIPQRPV